MMAHQITLRIVGIAIFGFFGLRAYQTFQRMQEMNGTQFQVHLIIALAFVGIAIAGLVMVFHKSKAPRQTD